MEIKIIKSDNNEVKHNFETSLFEGEAITHEKVYFESKDEFIDEFDKKKKGIEGCQVGVPEDYWFKEKGTNEIKGYFIFIKFSNPSREMVEYIIVMNRTIYITNKGQTIDVIV